MARYILALDFGGTKLSAGIVECTTGQVVERIRKLTPPGEDADECLEEMIQAGRDLLSYFQPGSGTVEGVGITFGGPLSEDRQVIRKSMYVSTWENKPLVDLISQTFGLPAVMDNDANAGALGEWRFGAGHGSRHMLYIQVSNGIGSGLFLNGHLYRGVGYAGEIGHTTVMVDGPLCACGKRGCLESLSSGWALARDGRDALRSAPPGSPLRRLSQNHPQAIDGKLIVDAALEGDEQARQIIDRAFTYLGVGIANTINLLAPDRVVIGGGMTKAGQLLLDPVRAAIDKHLIRALPPSEYPVIAISALGDNSPMIGIGVIFESEMR